MERFFLAACFILPHHQASLLAGSRHLEGGTYPPRMPSLTDRGMGGVPRLLLAHSSHSHREQQHGELGSAMHRFLLSAPAPYHTSGGAGRRLEGEMCTPSLLSLAKAGTTCNCFLLLTVGLDRSSSGASPHLAELDIEAYRAGSFPTPLPAPAPCLARVFPAGRKLQPCFTFVLQ